jgi:hypothetical protein
MCVGTRVMREAGHAPANMHFGFTIGAQNYSASCENPPIIEK